MKRACGKHFAVLHPVSNITINILTNTQNKLIRSSTNSWAVLQQVMCSCWCQGQHLHILLMWKHHPVLIKNCCCNKTRTNCYTTAGLANSLLLWFWGQFAAVKRFRVVFIKMNEQNFRLWTQCHPVAWWSSFNKLLLGTDLAVVGRADAFWHLILWTQRRPFWNQWITNEHGLFTLEEV